MKSFNNVFLVGLLFVAMFTVLSCNNDDSSPEILWEIPLSAKFQNPALSGRTESGLLIMRLHSHTTLEYKFEVYNLSSSDSLAEARFQAGDVLSNGAVILNFKPTFVNNKASGTLTIRQSLADSLWHSSKEIYFNVVSKEEPTGLVRGQVNTDIVLAADITLTGANQVPPITTTATGKAAIRVTTHRKMYSNVTVDNLEVNDALTAAHIHSGAAGVNGDMLFTLCTSASDFGVNKVQILSVSDISVLLKTNMYVNVLSTQHTSGVVRGQIKNAVSSPSSGPYFTPY